MHINKNPEEKKPIKKEGIIYALVFVLYAAIFILIFSYAIKFLSTTINSALSEPAGAAIEDKYGELDLESYSLIANKLNLEKVVQVIPEVEPEIITTEPEVASTSVEVATTSVPEIVVEPFIPVVEEPKVIEQRPTLIITNSTLKSGLAATLKNKLSSYTVLSTGNSRPSLAITTIKVKNSINPNSTYLAEIKKIVSESYDLVILPLADEAKSDIEIIIGNK